MMSNRRSITNLCQGLLLWWLCRQGDPGSTRYFLSLEDNMFRIFGGERVKSMMGMFQIEDLPIESGLLVGPDQVTLNATLGWHSLRLASSCCCKHD